MKTCSEKALEWNVTPRTVNAMCKNGRIQGAVKEKIRLHRMETMRLHRVLSGKD